MDTTHQPLPSPTALADENSTLIDNSLDLLALLDHEGRFMRVNAAARELLGYAPEELVGRLVVGVVNFPRKQIGPLMSECLVTGFHNERGEVALCVPDRAVPLGTRLL